MQGAAGHEAVQKPHGQRRQSLGSGNPDAGKRGKAREKPQHIQSHKEHDQSRQQLEGALKPVGQAGNAAQQPTKTAEDGTQGDVGDQPPQMVLEHGFKGGAPDTGKALTQADAAAHGQAVHRGQKPGDEEHSIAHGAVRQLGGHQQIQHAEVFQKKVEPPKSCQLEG